MKTTLAYDLQISEDALEATLSLPAGAGDLTEASELLELLEHEEGLVGIEEPAIEALLEDAANGRPAGPVLIARGEEPVDGEDARLEWVGEFFEHVPLQRPDGSVDHFRRHKTSVTAETLLARWIEPTQGTPGRSVRGDVLEPEPGRPWRPTLHHTVTWTDETHTAIEALVGGQVEFAKDRVSVSQVKKVSSVDFASSSIDFDGAVDVDGDVSEGFEVKAAGSVLVSGYVEAAPIVCGGRLGVSKGIIGRNKVAVAVDGDVEVGFARELELSCGGQLVSLGELMRVTAQIGGDVTAEGQRLVGGTWTVGGSLYVAELGSDAEVPTTITVGVSADLETKQAEQAEARTALQSEIATRREQIEGLERKRSRSEKEELALQKLRLYLGQLDRREREMGEAERLMRRRIKMQRRYGMTWVDRGVYPGVKIWAGGRPQPLEVTTFIQGPVRIGFMPGRPKPAITHGSNRKFESEW